MTRNFFRQLKADNVRYGFHFTLPAEGGTDWYLDVMGVPPRVPGFDIAWRRSAMMKTPWGVVPVVGVPDLVALKKTQRLEDYAVISRLVVALLSKSGVKPGPRLAHWALQNIFSPTLLADLIRRQAWMMTSFGQGKASLRAFGLKIVQGENPGPGLERRIEREMMERMTACRRPTGGTGVRLLAN